MNRLLLIAALAAATLISAAAAQEPRPRAQQFTLENGMQVVVWSDHRAPVATHMVWYRVGGADEEPGKSGLAHFFEHLMFRGTKKVPAGEFSQTVARNGGRHNAFTGQDYTAYYENVAVDRLDLVMGLEADRMTGLNLSEDVVLPELQVVREERRSRVDNNPASLFREQIMAAMYLAHPYGTPVIGWMADLESLTMADAVAFYRRHYAPDNAILVVSGDVTVDQVRALAEKHYGPIPPAGTPRRVRPAEPPQLAARRLTMSDARVTEPSWSRRYLAPSYLAGKSELADAMTVLSHVLGGGPTSRLYQQLVVKEKIAASAGAWYSPDSRDLGLFGLYGVPPAGGDVSVVERGADRVVAELLEKGVTAEEVARSKKKLVAEAVYARDSVSGTANIYGHALTIGRTTQDVEAWPDRIGAVTVEAVNEAAREVLVMARSVNGILLPEAKK